MKDKIIILTGMPGAGKGEMSSMLKTRAGVKHISTGELFRALDSETEIGKKVAEILASGKLVDDETVNQMVEPHLVSGQNILLDGYPRSSAQAKWLLEKVAADFDVVAILLEINEQVAEFRRDKRLRETLEKGETPRKDDMDPSALQKRFAEYREKTEPMLDFLRTELGDKFYTIDATGTLEEEYNQVSAILKNS